MKSFNLGKAVKKWLEQGKDYFFIASLLHSTPEECIDSYRKYMKFPPLVRDSSSIENLIKTKQKIHIYGETGTGKTYIIKQIAEKLNLRVFTSYARSEEDLVRDFSDYPFQEGDNIFVLEGDGFYWKRYGMIRKYIQDSKTAFVVITNGKDTPTKNITKHLKQIKMFPPTRKDVEFWLKQVGGDKTLNEVYDKDWRKVVRNYLHGRNDFKINSGEKFDAKTFAYKLLKGEAKYEDFANCIHPLPFILNWLAWNCYNFYENEDLTYNMEIISFIDANKYSLKQEFLKRYLLQFLPSFKKFKLYFPPFKRIKKVEKVEEKNFEVSNYKKRVVGKPTKKKEESKSIEEELGDFLLI